MEYLIGIIIATVLLIFIEIKIGKAIGNRISKTAGLVISIFLILSVAFAIIGVSILIYSNKKEYDNK